MASDRQFGEMSLTLNLKDQVEPDKTIEATVLYGDGAIHVCLDGHSCKGGEDGWGSIMTIGLVDGEVIVAVKNDINDDKPLMATMEKARIENSSTKKRKVKA